VSELSFDGLPDIPQVQTLARMASGIWDHEDVVALWVGGSLATGRADAYSDIDLRVAVRPARVSAWRDPDFVALLSVPCVGSYFRAFGEAAFLYHLLLANGDIYDFFVQTTEREPFGEPVVVLGCRDDDFAARLDQTPKTVDRELPIADPPIIRQQIVDFWVNSHKHRKVLHRGLDLLLLTGLHNDRSALTRLWNVLATGRDSGNRAPTIHGLTAIMRAVDELMGPDALRIVGGPTANREDICSAVEQIRDEVSRVGRLLAERLGFDYPDVLEETVRSGWSTFRAEA